jgi:hypothetical protein
MAAATTTPNNADRISNPADHRRVLTIFVEVSSV